MSKTYSIVAQLGTGNKCSASCTGTVSYSANIEQIPSYYYLSNIGNTSEEHKTSVIPEKTIEDTFTKTVSNSQSITSVYPVYHNVKNGILNDDTITEMSVTTSKTHTLSNVPSEEKSNKSFTPRSARQARRTTSVRRPFR